MATRRSSERAGTTAAELERSWDAIRARVPGDEHATPDAPLRQAYAQVGHRLRTLASDRRVTQRGLGTLQSEVVDVLSMSRLIATELERSTNEGGAGVPLALIQEGIDLVAVRLSELEATLVLLDTIASEAREVSDAVEELLIHRVASPNRFRRLAMHVLADVQTVATPDLLLPSPSLALEEWLRDFEEVEHPAVFVPALMTARLLGWAATHFVDWADRAELLILAALLQDVSHLYLDARRRKDGGGGSAELRRLHPRASACLAAGLADTWVELPVLIAQHHERIDGSGYPRGTTGGSLSPAARLVSAATRLIELRAATAESSSGPPAPRDSSADSAARLWHETRRGGFDATASAMLITTLGHAISDEFAEEASGVQKFALTAFGARHFRRDPNQVAVPAPHLMNAGMGERGPSERRRTEAASVPILTNRNEGR